ncbi:DMT family transporter [Phycicoccus sp. SLBN-51]|jgi:drug/metabolite transporter (DMT)-like permease|uniref:DMT family transporter n=1 Tax=Phycicoccus sp. SLBN-51 TaxID=2768447 RepID=UPI00114FDA6E|nr:DMT family transporter [Phycicoccus sp. SLBN-51]TQJ50485.1 putative membrane protein [Phycicoccus sp. SLBN-51]
MLSLLALASSACWGTSDFFAGLKSRDRAAAAVVAWSQGLGLVAISVVVLLQWRTLTFDGWPLWSVAAGLSGAGGLVCFYSALGSGTMGVVAPVASLGVVVPVLLGLLGGEQPAASAWFGMLLAVLGVALASGPELSGDVSPRPVLLASVAAVGFGLALYCLDRGARQSLLHTLWGMRLTSVLLFVVAGLVLRTAGGIVAREVPALFAIGLGDLVANGLFAFASSRGLVSVASVLGSLYPVVTVLWARFLLQERLRPVQSAGVVLTLVGVAVIAA